MIRTLIALLFSLLPLLCFSAQTLFEDKLMQCLCKSYTNDEILKIELKDFENSLVEKAIFVENNQPNFKLILKFIEALPYQKNIQYPDLDYIDISSLKRNNIDSSACMEKLIDDSNIVEKVTFLKYQMVMNQFVRVQDKVKAAADLLKLFKESDYKYDVYKLGIISLLTHINVNSGMKTKILEVDTNSESQKKLCDDLEVKLTPDNEITINGKISNVRLLKEAIKKHYLDNDEGCFSLAAHRNALYDTYLKVDQAIRESRALIRNEYSRKVFNKEYENLNVEQQNVIRLKKKFKFKEKDYN